MFYKENHNEVDVTHFHHTIGKFDEDHKPLNSDLEASILRNNFFLFSLFLLSDLSEFAISSDLDTKQSNTNAENDDPSSQINDPDLQLI